jgi:hypothetical protein
MSKRGLCDGLSDEERKYDGEIPMKRARRYSENYVIAQIPGYSTCIPIQN